MRSILSFALILSALGGLTSGATAYAACSDDFNLVEVVNAPLPTTGQLKERARLLVTREIECRQNAHCGVILDSDVLSSFNSGLESIQEELLSVSEPGGINTLVPNSTVNTEAKKILEYLLMGIGAPPEGEQFEDLVPLTTTFEKACVSAIAVNQSITNFNNQSSQSPPSGTTVLLPDSRFEYQVPRSAAFGDGKLIDPTKSNVDRHRLLIADQFERMARIFMAGTDQLARDFPHLNGAAGHQKQFPQPIYGMYQGYQPDLVYSDAVQKIMQGPLDSTWGNCGVANINNGANRFKSASGGYQNENISGSTINSYIAQPPAPGSTVARSCVGAPLIQRRDYALGRGRLMEKMFKIMKSVTDDIKVGRINSASVYGGTDTTCAKMRAEIAAYREDLYGPVRGRTASDKCDGGQFPCFLTGLPADGRIKALECQREDDKTEVDQINEMNSAVKIIHKNQERSCHLAAMQAQIEIRMVTQYAYCVFKSAGSNQMERLLRSLVSQVDVTREPDAEPLTEKTPVECATPSLFAFLFSLLASFSRTRISRRMLQSLLMLACVSVCLMNTACNPETTTGVCAQGFGYDNGAARLDFMALNTGQPFHPYEGWGAQKTGSSNCIGGRCGTANVQSWFNSNNVPSTAAFVPICEYKCKNLKIRVDEYKKKTQAGIDSGKLSPTKIAEAQSRMSEYSQMYNDALGRCGQQRLSVYKERWNRKTMRESAEKGQAGCMCDESTGLGFGEVIPEGPGETYEEAKKESDKREGAPDQGSGSAGATPPPNNGGTVVSGGNPQQLASVAGPSSGQVTTRGNANESGKTKASATAGADGTAGLSKYGFAPDGESDGNLNGAAPGMGGGLSGFGPNAGGKALGTTAAGAGSAGAGKIANGTSYAQAGGGAGATGAGAASAGAGSNGYGAGGYGSGSSVNPGGDGENTVMSFGGSDSDTSRNLAAMGSADPEDYFSRIGLDESLFKKVERRYNQKATNWVLVPMGLGTARKPAATDIPLIHPSDLNR